MSQQAEIEWRDGAVPVSTRFDDPYFSLENGLAETAHVFLQGNGLPERFHDGFQIAELGFGTGSTCWLRLTCGAKPVSRGSCALPVSRLFRWPPPI